MYGVGLAWRGVESCIQLWRLRFKRTKTKCPRATNVIQEKSPDGKRHSESWVCPVNQKKIDSAGLILVCESANCIWKQSTR